MKMTRSNVGSATTFSLTELIKDCVEANCTYKKINSVLNPQLKTAAIEINMAFVGVSEVPPCNAV